MTALTIGAVRAWRPEALYDAADALRKAAETFDDGVEDTRRATELAVEHWRGSAADAANERYRRDVRDGRALVDALRTMRNVLDQGAAQLAALRADLLIAVDAALAAGFAVAEDGTVSALPLPPAFSAVGYSAQADAQRALAQSERDCAAGTAHGGVSRALQALMAADQDVADALRRIEVPASMRTEVDRIVARLTATPLDEVLAWGVGGARLVQTGFKAHSVVDKSLTYLTLLGKSADNWDLLRLGDPAGGFLGKFGQPGLGRAVGKAFLPLTVASGIWDTATGGGHEGARDWATRGFGVAGAAGAGFLMAGGGMLGSTVAGVALFSNPVGLGIAGAAVLGYGAWQLGNLVYDHREAIGDFFGKTVEWTGEGLSKAGDWTGDRLGDVADFGKKLLPAKLPDLTPW